MFVNIFVEFINALQIAGIFFFFYQVAVLQAVWTSVGK